MSPHARHGLLVGLAVAISVALSGVRILSGAAVPPGVPVSGSERVGPATRSVRPERVGSIEGVVTIPRRPPPRVANRYPTGAAAPAPLPIQDIPAVVYIEGAVAGVGAPAPRTIEIAQKDSTFVPAAVIVPVGGTVAFPNQDPIFHSVFSSSQAKRLDLGRYPQGESKSVLFDQPGVVKVYCNVHKHMRSAVVVVQNPFNAVVGADGRFRITNVPAGRHTLVIWHADHDPEEVQVTVPENGVARVEVTVG
jgi:plastocyanin